MNPFELHDQMIAMLNERGLGDDFKAVLSWPGHAVADRELTEADTVEAQRLADEHWCIEIRPRRAEDARRSA